MSKGFTYTLEIDAEISDLVKKLELVKNSMKTAMDAGKAPGAEKVFTKIETAIEKLKEKTSQPIVSLSQFEAIKREVNGVETQFKQLSTITEKIASMDLADKMELLPPDLKAKIEQADQAIKLFNTSLSKAEQKSEELATAEKNLANAKNELVKAEGKVQAKKSLVAIQEQAVQEAQKEAKAINEKKQALEKFLKTQEAYEKAGGDKRKAGGGKKELEGQNLPADRAAAASAVPGLDLKDTKAVQAEIARLQQEYLSASKAVTDAENTQRRYNKQLNEANNVAQITRDKVSNLENTVETLNTEFEKNKATNVQAAYTKLRTEAGKLGIDLKNIPIDYTEQNLQELNECLNRLATAGIAKVDQDIDNLQTEFEETGNAVQNLGSKMQSAGTDVEQLDQKVKSGEAFAQRLKQFVGLEGGIQIARRAMQRAMETIKELDKAMTEMAVVTDLEIGDYWNQLADHTERANALGLAIKDIYEAETLYYQQGLKTEQVMAMSNETLKMGRIAGLSAADATNKMTAALRGFNMELNETSTQRVADVYSELAAITASDVNEISEAMTKTASIANSAGMEFETTAAFLSQIIETTRESAETAGTALKTVIARFQELKKDPAEIGEVDGEVVDANKIETALRSVGVALRDANGQFRDLDDVFLELASKWNTLDTNTQRYVATIAAGSRQQSRFIAMMQDYNRTQELVSAANTSAGASNAQFEKTMDSLESKLNQLKNAWDTFVMGIMDSTLLKLGIDLLTGLMTAINGVIEFFDKLHLGGVASIGLIVAALYLGAKAIDIFGISLKKTGSVMAGFGAVGRAAADSISKKFLKMGNTISKITKRPVLLNTKVAQKSANDYINAQKRIMTISAEREALEKNTSLSDTARAVKKEALDKQEILAEEQKAAAVTKYALAQGLTASQTTSFLALQELGIGLDWAEKIAKEGLTDENAELLRTELLKQGLDETQVGTIMTKVGAISAEQVSEESKQTTDKKGIALLWSKVVGYAATLKATIAQTLANWGLQASFWPILVIGLLIVAAFIALAAIIMVVVSAIKAFIANSPEGKLKAAEEASKAASVAAEEAAEAYNNLADSFENLEDKYNALEELTEGSREWRDAIKEINKEVVDLVEQYPELAGLVESDGGILKLDIDSAEAQAVLDKYEAKSIQASSAEIASKMAVLEAQNAVDYKNLSNDAELGSQAALGWQKAAGYAIGGIAASTSLPITAVLGGAAAGAIISDAHAREQVNKQNTEAMAKVLADGMLMQNEDGSWQATEGFTEADFEELGLTIDQAIAFGDELGDGAEELRAYGEEVKARTEQEKALYEAMAMNAISLVDTANMTAEEMDYINTAGSAEYMESFKEAGLKQIEEETADMGKGEKKDYYKEKAAEIYGVDASQVSVDKNGNVTIEDEDGEEKEITAENFKNQLAAYEGTEAAAKALEKLPEALKSVPDAMKAMYSSKDGKGMTKSQIEEMSKKSEDELKKLFAENAELQAVYGGNMETFLKEMESMTTAGEKALAQAQQASVDAGIEMMDGLSMEAARGYADQMRNLYLLGEAASDTLDSKLQTLTSNLNETDKTKFIGALNALDWQSVESLESLPETLENIGVSVPNDQLQAYIENLKEVAGATRNIDLNKLQESSKTLLNLSKSIESGNQKRSFSEEDFKSLTEAIPELAEKFQLGLDGQYTYLGSSMEDLQKAIEENTKALLQEKLDQLTNQVNLGHILTNMKITDSANTATDLTKWESWSEESQKAVLKTIQTTAKENNTTITGIAGYGNDSNVDDLKTDEIESIFTSLLEQKGGLAKNTSELNKLGVSTAATIYQKDFSADNATKLNSAIGEGKENEFEARARALAAQAGNADVDSVTFDAYSKALEKYQKEAANSTTYTKELENAQKELVKISQKLANESGYSGMKKGLQQWFEQIGDISEQYSKIADGDVAGKIMAANNALSNLGLQVDSAEKADEYMKLMELASQGDVAAMSALANATQTAMGVTQESLDSMDSNAIAFYDKMAENSFGYWQALEGGSKQFIWATGEELATVANMAGTAIESWENPYDWLFNFNEQINQQIREREKAERAFTKALEDETKTAADLLELSKQELDALQQQAELQSVAVGRAHDNIQEAFTKANPEFLKYVQYDANNKTITTDSEGLEAAGFTEEEREAFEEFVSTIEENRDTILDAEEALEDIEDQVEEIGDRGKEETSELYNQIKEGLIQSRQEEIDALSDINSSIQDAQSQLVDKIQEQIDDTRQARENEKTENDITDKEARLAFLMRDTSGGNALEIASLQQDIADAKQGYQDTLIDQSLQSLQDANAKAAEQRQQQIDLAQMQLDAYANSSLIWQQVESILYSSLLQAQASENFEQAWRNTEAGHFIAVANNINSLNPIEKQIAQEEINANAKLASLYTGAAAQTAENAEKLRHDVVTGKLDAVKTTLESSEESLSGNVNSTTKSVGQAKKAINDTEEAVGSLGDSTGTIPKGIESVAIGGGENTSKIVKALDGLDFDVNIDGNKGEVITTTKIGNSSERTSTTTTTTYSFGSTNSSAGKDKSEKVDNKSAKLVAKRTNAKVTTDGNNLNYKDLANGDTDMAGGVTVGDYTGLNLDFKGSSSSAATAARNAGISGNEIFEYNGKYYVYSPGGEAYAMVEGARKWNDFKDYVKVYETGGLADFTGPAWLDGTKSKPEMVLNQKDTVNFIILKDILSEILSGTSGLSKDKEEKTGDNYFDIEINVDNLGDDYDVEQLADKIRSMIYEDASYRNVNTINNLR